MGHVEGTVFYAQATADALVHIMPDGAILSMANCPSGTDIDAGSLCAMHTGVFGKEPPALVGFIENHVSPCVGLQVGRVGIGAPELGYSRRELVPILASNLAASTGHTFVSVNKDDIGHVLRPPYIAQKGFVFGNGGVGIAHMGGEEVGAIPGEQSSIAPVPRHTHHFHHFPIHFQWPQAPGYIGHCRYFALGGGDNYLLSVLNTKRPASWV